MQLYTISSLALAGSLPTPFVLQIPQKSTKHLCFCHNLRFVSNLSNKFPTFSFRSQGFDRSRDASLPWSQALATSCVATSPWPNVAIPVPLESLANVPWRDPCRSSVFRQVVETNPQWWQRCLIFFYVRICNGWVYKPFIDVLMRMNCAGGWFWRCVGVYPLTAHVPHAKSIKQDLGKSIYECSIFMFIAIHHQTQSFHV